MTSMDIPGKSLFKADEVSSITGVKPYVLRFWESEFDEISPIVSSSGRRLYEHKDIQAIALVKKMLFDDKMDMEKVKLELKVKMGSVNDQKNEDIEKDIHTIADNLEKLVMVKARLNNVLSMTSALKEKHHWS